MPARVDATAFIAGLPKAELHVHLQGAASPETILELSRRHPGEGLPTDIDAMREFYRFRSFEHFLDVYMQVNRLVKYADDVRALVVGLAGDLAAVQVRYAEVTVTADSHLKAGIAPDDLAAALEAGRDDALRIHHVVISYVYDINGFDGMPGAERTIAFVEGYLPAGSVGFGIGGPEAGVSRAPFADVFRRAERIGLMSVPHAGEATGPQSVRDSIDLLGAVRIGHGLAAARDPALMDDLVERDVVLEICLTSNLRTAVVRSIEEHPITVFREAGVRITLNTDDPGMFETDLNREYLLAHDTFGIDLPGLADLARESVRSSIASPSMKALLLAEIDSYAAAHLA